MTFHFVFASTLSRSALWRRVARTNGRDIRKDTDTDTGRRQSGRRVRTPTIV